MIAAKQVLSNRQAKAVLQTETLEALVSSPWPDASGSSPSPRASTIGERSRCFDTNLSRPKPACIARRFRENGGC